ncbi:slc25a42 [Symbiodinium sp. CCMP2592]|nr:slc25a42 [Symbiodinium sp. CCMP2592]
MALRGFIALSLPLLALAKGSLRGGDLQCTGEGNLPAGPVCYGGTLLSETFKIHVVSHDGEVGIVDMKAEGPQEAECDGAQFQNEENVITIENDHGCGLSNYEYSVQYCPDQDNLMINIVKPFSVRMVLESQTCPPAGEV